MSSIRMPGQSTYVLANRTLLLDEAKAEFMLVNQKDFWEKENEAAKQGKFFSRDLYLEMNRDKLDEFVAKIAASTTMNPRVPKFMSDAGTIIQTWKYLTPMEHAPQAKIDAYKNFYAPIAADILNAIKVAPDAPVQTTSQFMEKVVNISGKFKYAFNKEYGVHDNVFAQERALENIRNKGGRFVEFDLEGIGRGIHEFSFMDFDPTINNAAHVNTKTAVNGIIGMNDAQYLDAISFINQYEKGVHDVNLKFSRGIDSKEMYRIMSLAKFGDDRTTWEKAADGTIRLTGYVNDTDISYKDAITKARRGAERLRGIWDEQTKHLVDFSAGSKNYKVFAHEAAILNKVMQMKQSGVTMVTQNGLGYDIGMINEFFTGTQASKDAYDAWRSITGSGDVLNVVNHFDVTAVLRERNKLGWALEDSAGEVAKAKADWNSSTALMIRYAGGQENVANMVRSALGGMYVQHAAVSDTVAQGIEFQKMMETIFNPNHKSYALKQDGFMKEHNAKVGDIFYVGNGRFSNNGYGNLGFTYDELTKEFRFAGGVKVSASGEAGEEIVSQGLKKNSLAMLVGMKRISLADLPQNMVDEIGVDAGQRELIATYFMPYGGNVGAAQTNNLQVHISTEAGTREFFGNLMFTGNMDTSKVKAQVGDVDHFQLLKEAASGNYNNLVKTNDVDKFTRKALSVDGGKYSFEALAARNEKILAMDSAANWIRTIDYGKWQKVEQYLRLVEEEAANIGQGGPINTDLIRKSAKSLNEKALNDAGVGNKLRKAVQTELWNGQDFFMSNTADNMLKSVGYLHEMREVYRVAAKAAKSFGNSKRERNLYFSAVMDNLLAGIAMKTANPVNGRAYDIYGASGRNKVGMGASGLTYDNTLSRLGFENNIFRVDIESMLGIDRFSTNGTINSQNMKYLDIDISSNSPHWAKRLATQIGAKEGETVSALNWLIRNLNRRYEGLHIAVPQEYNADSYMASIVKGLSHYRKSHPNVALPPRIAIPDLSKASDMMLEFFSQHTEDERTAIYQNILANSPVATYVDGKNADYEDIANKLTDRLFAETKDVTAERLKGYGYSDSAVIHMLRNRDRRMRDTAQLLRNVLESAIKNNPYLTISYNIDNAALAISAGKDHTLDFSKYLVVDRFNEEAGEFYTQLGGRRMATKSGFVYNSKKSQKSGFEIHSWISQFERGIISRSGFAKSKNIGPEEMLSRLDWAFRDAADEVSINNINRYDAQERRAGMAYSLEGYFSNLGYLTNEGAFDKLTYPDKLRKTLDELADAYSESKDGIVKPSTKQLGVLYSYFDEIMAPLGDANSEVSRLFWADNNVDGEEYRKYVHGNISVSSMKHPEKMEFFVSNDDIASPLAGITKDKRAVENIRTLEFDYDGRAQRLGQAKSIIRPGSILMNDIEHAVYDGLGGRTKDSRLIVRKASMDSDTLAGILNDYIEHLKTSTNKEEVKELNKYKNLHQLYSTLNESGGMADPILLDILPKSIIEKESTKTMALRSELIEYLGWERAEEALKVREQTAELIKFVKGAVVFDYGNDVYVKAGADLDWEKNFEKGFSAIKSDTEGFASLRLFDAGTGEVVSTSRINEILNKKENLKVLSGYAGNAGLLRREAGRILGRYGITEKYIIDSPFENSFKKLLDYSEKQGTRFVMGALGEFDERIAQAIGKQAGARSLYLTADVLSDFNKLNKVLENTEGYSKIAWSDYVNLDFANAALAEKRKYFDFFRSALEWKYNDRYEFGKDYKTMFGDVLMAGNTFSEFTKPSHMEFHGNIEQKLATAVDYMVRDKLNSSDLSSIDENVLKNAYSSQRDDLLKILQGKKIFTDKDGNSVIEAAGDHSFTLGKFTKIKTKELEEILGKKIGLKHYYEGDAPGKGVMFVPAQIGAVWDADEGKLNTGGNKKGVYATRRLTLNLEQQLYGKNSLERVWDSYIKSAGDMSAAADNFNKTFAGIASVAPGEGGNYVLQMEEGAEGSKMNRGLIRNIHEEILAGDNYDDIVNINDNASVWNASRKTGISENKIKFIVQGAREHGYERVGTNYIMHQHAYEMTHLANIINHKLENAYTLQEQREIAESYSEHFVMKSLKEIADVARKFDEKSPDRVTRSMMVDLGSTVADITNTQYLALPYQSFTVMGNRNGEGIKMFGKLMNEIHSLSNSVARYESLDRSSNEAERIARVIKDKVSGIMDTAKLMETSKFGEMAEGTSGYLYGSGMFKAGILNDAGGKNPLLQRAMYDGTSIAELMSQGRKVNAAFVGRDFFENALGGAEIESALSAISKSSGEDVKLADLMGSMLEAAKTEGVKGITLRQPMGYFNSVASTQIYLDETLSRNHMLQTAGLAEGMKTDMDGDTIFNHLTRTNVEIMDGDKVISSVRLNELQIRQMESHLKTLREKGAGDYTLNYDSSIFDELKRSNDYLANSAYSDKVGEFNNDIKEALVEQYYKEGAAVDGNNYAFKNMTSQERLAINDRYERLVNSDEFRSMLGDKVLEDMSGNELANVATEYVQGISNAAEREMTAQAFAYGAMRKNFESEITAKLARQDAGIVNMSTHAFRNVIATLQDARERGVGIAQTAITDADAKILGALATHLEEAGQAGKNAAQNWDPGDLSVAMEEFFGVRGRKPNAERLFSIIENEWEVNKENGGIKELKKLSGDAVVQNVSRVEEALLRILPEGTSISRNAFKALQKQGYTKSIFEDDSMIGNSNDLGRLMQEISQKSYMANGLEEAAFSEGNILVKSARVMNHSGEELLRPEGLDSTSNPTLSEHIGGAFKGLKKAFSGHGAMAMLGFAGVTMMAGVMGGAPTAPPSAQGQAQGIQSDNAMYEIPSTMGTPGNAKSANQSYIININASTDRGRDFAETALKQAFSAMPRKEQGINMTMNIKDSSSNIGYSDIASQLTDML